MAKENRDAHDMLERCRYNGVKDDKLMRPLPSGRDVMFASSRQ